MGFHHRKLLNQHHYLSSTMSSPTPSPSPLKPLALKPKQWLPYFDNHEHEHVLREAMIGIACMVGMVVFTCTISLILRYYYSRRSHNHINNNTRRRNSPILFDFNGNFGVVSDDEGPVIEHPIWFIRTEGLQESVIDSITVFKYRKKEGVIDGTECSVCLGEFEHEESLKLMPKCSHAFHIPCIDTWLRSHKNCPLCRAPVVHDAAAEPDLEVSGQNHIENLNGTEEGTSSALRIGNDDSEGEDSEIDKVNCHALIGSEEVEVEEEIQPMRRSVSMDSSSASMIFCDVVDLNCDLEGSNTHLDDKNNSSNKDMIISKQGSASSTIYRLGSIGRAFQKRPISLRGSFSHNTKFIFSRHCRSQSSTLPL